MKREVMMRRRRRRRKRQRTAVVDICQTEEDGWHTQDHDRDPVDTDAGITSADSEDVVSVRLNDVVQEHGDERYTQAPHEIKDHCPAPLDSTWYEHRSFGIDDGG